MHHSRHICARFSENVQQYLIIFLRFLLSDGTCVLMFAHVLAQAQAQPEVRSNRSAVNYLLHLLSGVMLWRLSEFSAVFLFQTPTMLKFFFSIYCANHVVDVLQRC